jgi:hypothetical protein
MDDMDRDNRGRGSEDEDDNSSSSKSDPLSTRLKTLVSVFKSGFAPVVSVLALIVSLFALNAYQTNREQLSEANQRINNLSSSLADSKGDLDFFKVPIAHEKAMRAEERRKQVERETKIIKSVTQLQTKLKVFPTLEEQLREVASASVVSTTVSNPIGIVSAPAATIHSSAASAVVSIGAVSAVTAVPDKNNKKQQQASTTKVTTTEKKPPVVPKAADKTTTKAQALKEAIERFNKNQ